MRDNNSIPLIRRDLSQVGLIVASTSAALIAFAANSILCRLALGSSNIDPASFTAVRLFSGAITLLAIAIVARNNRALLLSSFKQLMQVRSWLGPLMLTSYAVFFSFAYVQLNTATGALILFATVQFSLLVVNRFKGNLLGRWGWFGLMISFVGFSLLVIPKISQPSWSGLIMMIIAGIAWAFYTLAGKGSKNPIVNTALNFVLSVPLVLVLFFIFIQTAHWNNFGLLMAVASGALASGVGYAIWYNALNYLSISQAAVSQLTVPLIAALGGTIFLDEALTSELIFSAFLILLGLAIVVVKKVNN